MLQSPLGHQKTIFDTWFRREKKRERSLYSGFRYPLHWRASPWSVHFSHCSEKVSAAACDSFDFGIGERRRRNGEIIKCSYGGYWSIEIVSDTSSSSEKQWSMRLINSLNWTSIFTRDEEEEEDDDKAELQIGHPYNERNASRLRDRSPRLIDSPTEKFE